MPYLFRLVRNVSGRELRDYFTGSGVTFPESINWDGENGEIVPPVLKAVDALPDVERERIRVDCDRIDRMTTDVGQTAIMSVATSAQQDALGAIGVRHARALWLFRNDPTRFRQAEDVAFFENARHGRIWDGFIAPKGLAVSRDEERHRSLAALIRRFFREGERVKIEVFDRRRPDSNGNISDLVQVIVYREGLPDSVEIFKDHENIGPLVYRPVYELGFTYEPASGVIEVVGNRKVARKELAKTFAETLLDHAIDGARLPPRHFDLSVFMTDRKFPTDPQDGIGPVRLRLVKFERLDESAFLTIEARTTEESVHTLAEQMFEERNPFRGGYRIREVVLSASFLPDSVNPRGRTISIKLRHPNGSDLKEKTDKERLLGEKYLRRWGIAVDLAA